MFKEYLEIKDEISEAIKNNLPVVALESTIISHGMPYPQNVETAKSVEKMVRENGAIPATIAILNGKLVVGLDNEQLELLAKGKNIAKVSRRDLPFMIARKMNGATTVATTMIIANLAGIKFFATGGIGGVHRNGTETFDVSADLQELSKTNVAVICAGAKSILDIGLTLEYLETHGVPVVGIGTDEFPAFYTRKSGFSVDYEVDDFKDLALALKSKWDLELEGGMVVSNPIPEEYSMDHNLINSVIENALLEADKNNIKGKDVTPFLLSKISSLTSGDSLKANIKLVLNNARVASLIAVEFARLS